MAEYSELPGMSSILWLGGTWLTLLALMSAGSVASAGSILEIAFSTTLSGVLAGVAAAFYRTALSGDLSEVEGEVATVAAFHRNRLQQPGVGRWSPGADLQDRSRAA